MNQPLSFFDQLSQDINPEPSDTEKDVQIAKFERLDYLIHQVFKQNKEGAELLAIWKETLIMDSCAFPGADMLTVGLKAGSKQFIRSIILTINKVEE